MRTHWNLRLRVNRRGHIKQCNAVVDIIKGKPYHCGQVYEEVVIKGKRISKRRCMSHALHISPKPPRKRAGGKRA
jgi:hypothetical protein